MSPIDNNKTTQSDYEDARYAIDRAVRLLKPTEAEAAERSTATTEARARLTKANGYKSSDYTSTTYAALTQAKTDLNNVLKDQYATSIQINTATDNLNKAISGLKAKKTNPLKVTFANKTYKASALKKKSLAYKAVTIKKKGQGTVSYTVKFANSKSKKALSFNKKTGKITVKKKTKKGKYKVTITVKAAGNGTYKASKAFKKAITVTVK